MNNDGYTFVDRFFLDACCSILSSSLKHFLYQDHKTDKLDGELVRYLAPSIALFERVDDDDLLPIRVIGIQACLERGRHD